MLAPSIRSTLFQLLRPGRHIQVNVKHSPKLEKTAPNFFEFSRRYCNKLCAALKKRLSVCGSVENLNLVGLARGILGKHCLDAGWGQFFQVLEQCCFKRGVFFLKVDARKTSSFCPNCLTETGKKELSQRVHACGHCGYTTDRDIAAAQFVLIRGLAAVGHTVKMLSEGKAVALPVTKESPS